MTDKNSVWEQNFRQPLDADITTELGRLSQQVASVNARNLQTEGVNNTQQTQIDSKAPINTPTFTGLVSVPLPPSGWEPSSPRALSQHGHQNAHSLAVWQYTGGAAQTVGAAWSVFNQAGVLSTNLGNGLTLGGGGGLGVVVNADGVYDVTVEYQYVVISHPPGACRLITGLSFNGAVSVIADSQVVTNLAGVSYVSSTWTGPLVVMNLRGMVFVEGGASLSVTPRRLVVRRVG